LTDDHIISEENKEMLLKRRKRSLCYFGIGETNTSDDSHAKELKLDNSYMIYNGAVITDLKEDKIILNKC
jgi:hydroxymethylpyrimidine pyrophosphatase-like HAD family hydrolase